MAPESASVSPRTLRPRPAARGLRWHQLIPPTQEAVAQLLHQLDAAVEIARQPPPAGSKSRDPGSASRSSDVNSSLLVTGSRGSGKSTVLLSSRFAFENPDDFFKGSSGTGTSALKDVVRRQGGHVVWLDILDLEPLPSKANLLATLLVRIRGALDHSRDRHAQGVSLYQQGPEDCWSKIDKLIRDATLMWEDPAASDIRLLADQQIRAAEIYASFRKDFSETIGHVCKLLMNCSGPDNGQTILALPIDNVDRSSSHLHKIIKLSQLVGCRQLWLILAAGRDDFQVLLEQAFRDFVAYREAAETGQRDGENEMLAILRRQAAATQRQILPPMQQIHIRDLEAEETWRFTGPRGEENRRLQSLLGRISVEKSPEAAGRGPETLQGLLSFSDQVPAAVQGNTPESEKKLPLNEMGYQALSLPVRNAVDLWQTVVGELESTSDSSEKVAIRIATRMLRDAIRESSLPNWAASQLLGSIVVKDPHRPDLINLDLSFNPLRGFKNISSCLSIPLQGNPWALKAELQFHDFSGYTVKLRKPGGQWLALPPQVQGWLMILYDLLFFVPGPRIINEELEPRQQDLAVAATVLTLELDDDLVELRLPWTIPLWESFFERLVFLDRWKDFTGDRLEFVTTMKQLVTFLQDQPKSQELMLLAWIDNVCSLGEGKSPNTPLEIPAKLLEKLTSNLPKRIHALYQKLRGRQPYVGDEPRLKRWLEVDLWILLRSQFQSGTPLQLEGALADYWEANAHYLEMEWKLYVRRALADTDWYRERKDRAGSDRLLTKTTTEVFKAIRQLCGYPAEPPT